jgi:biopolymer transport protein ExbD
MNFRNPRSSRNTAIIEITPLVDIIFQLLIFFLLTATYVKNPYLDINLPEASLNKVTHHKKDIDIGVAEDGEIKYDNQNISIEKLESLLRAEYAANAEAVVVIRADKSSKHGRVVDVMDLAKRIGFDKLAIAIQAKTGSME